MLPIADFSLVIGIIPLDTMSGELQLRKWGHACH